MEKRIKVASSSKNTVENTKKQDSGGNSKVFVAKERLVNKTAAENEINTKRTISSIEIQEKPFRRLKNKELARRSRARLKNKKENDSASESADDDENLDGSLMINDKKTKKLKSQANFPSRADEVEAPSELTDEETQTSKAEENSNPHRTPNVMDQFGLGQSFREQSFQQQKLLRKVLNSNFSPTEEDKSNINNVDKNSISENHLTTENGCQLRQGHYSYGDKPLRIVKTAYNESINDITFTMDWKQDEQNNIRPATSQITREELLKFDPLLLVYYYEKHLEFPHYPDQPDFDLEKIPH